MSRWDRFFKIIQDHDPYDHLRSIHNGDVEKNGATGFVVAEKEAFALCVAVTNPNQVLSLIEL